MHRGDGEPEPEIHALARLRERYGVSLSLDQLREIETRLACPRARLDADRVKLVIRMDRERSFWLVNLTEYVGRPLWALAAYKDPPGLIATFFPAPVNLTPAQADRWLRGNPFRRGKPKARVPSRRWDRVNRRWRTG